MITTPAGEIAFTDQLLAVLAEGPATTEEVAARAGLVVCVCPLCDGPRPARPHETFLFLSRLCRTGEVRGEIVNVVESCPDCGDHDRVAIRWERT